MVVWNPDKSFVVSESLLYHKHKMTPYLNEELYGVVEQTYLGGQNVFNHGTITQLNAGKRILRHGND